MTRQCAGFRRDGTPCTVTVEPPQRYCWWHDPRNSERRKRAAARGGKAKVNPLTKELHGRLEDLTDRVVGGTLETSRGAVAAQLINARIRLVEVERRFDYQRELQQRIEQLQAKLEAIKEQRRWGA